MSSFLVSGDWSHGLPRPMRRALSIYARQGHDSVVPEDTHMMPFRVTFLPRTLLICDSISLRDDWLVIPLSMVYDRPHKVSGEHAQEEQPRFTL